jgi:hypothetical protein
MLLKNDVCVGVCESMHVIFDALHGPTGHPIHTDFSTFHVILDALLLHQKPRQVARGQTGHPMCTEFFTLFYVFFWKKNNFAQVRSGKLDTQYIQIFLSILCKISLV